MALSNFSFWSYKKDRVYHKISENITDLKARIRHGITSITKETLQKAFLNNKNRRSIVICQNSGHLETYYVGSNLRVSALICILEHL